MEYKAIRIIEDFILTNEKRAIDIQHLDNMKLGDIKDKANEFFGEIQTLRMKLAEECDIKFYPHYKKRD